MLLTQSIIFILTLEKEFKEETQELSGLLDVGVEEDVETYVVIVSKSLPRIN